MATNTMTKPVSAQFNSLADLYRTPHEWQRDRQRNGWNYAEAAKFYGISIREWAMLECGTTPHELAAGLYPRAGGRTATPAS